MGAFGVAGLMSHPGCHTDDDALRITKRSDSYKEIIEFTTCLLVQITVDAIFNRRTARGLTMHEMNNACNHLKAALTRFFFVQDPLTDKSAIPQEIQPFFEAETDHPLKFIREQVARVNAKVTLTEQFSENAKPHVELVPGYRTPFKEGLCRTACNALKLLASDLNLLAITAESGVNDWKVKSKLEKAAEYRSADDSDDPVEHLTRDEIVTCRQRGEWLIRMSEGGNDATFIRVKDMVRIVEGTTSRRPRIMDLVSIAAAFDHVSEDKKDPNVKYREPFVSKKQFQSLALLVDTMSKCDETVLDNPYLAELRDKPVHDGAEQGDILQQSVYTEVQKKFGTHAERSSERSSERRMTAKSACVSDHKFITDDLIVRACVTTVAIEGLHTHFAL